MRHARGNRHEHVRTDAVPLEAELELQRAAHDEVDLIEAMHVQAGAMAARWHAEHAQAQRVEAARAIGKNDLRKALGIELSMIQLANWLQVQSRVCWPIDAGDQRQAGRSLRHDELEVAHRRSLHSSCSA